jgi:hypothetical protein
LQDLSNLDGAKADRICEDILKLDSSIIFVSFGSFTGIELAFAESPSFSTLVGRSPHLKEEYSSIVMSVIRPIRQAVELFGNATSIITNFERNLRIVVIPLFPKQVFLFMITTREADSKTLIFQVSKILQSFEE